mmetsp:Transcript_12870/g.36628  ORF Transcript_12870/g.36628 Transcript_12870/m.36628 type:complete len:319 (+) Transcript_12870:202-1158(+)
MVLCLPTAASQRRALLCRRCRTLTKCGRFRRHWGDAAAEQAAAELQPEMPEVAAFVRPLLGTTVPAHKWEGQLSKLLRALSLKSQRVSSVLQAHGWTGRQFREPPDLEALLRDVEATRFQLDARWRERYAHVHGSLARDLAYKPRRAREKWGRMALVDPGSRVSLVAFLYRHAHLLDKEALLEVLTHPRDREHSLKAWMHHLSAAFRGVSLCAAVRVFMERCSFPREAGSMDPIMQSMAEVYVDQNPGTLPNVDVAFILLFSVVCLSADLGGPGVRSRTTVDAFIRNNRGINNGEDLPAAYLKELYADVVHSPFVYRK